MISTFNPEKDTAIFIHIPKTAGTTLQGIIWRYYHDDELHIIHNVDQAESNLQKMAPAQRCKIRMVTGHISFGLHQYFTQPAAYFTILRDPVELVLSYYYYVQRTPDHPHHPLIAPKTGMTLEQFLESRIDENVHNIQTRRIAGMPLGSVDTPCTAATLAQAQDNIQQHFVAVGLVEKFDTSTLLFGQLFDWSNLFYAKMNTTGRRPRKADISSETRKAITQANAIDMALYQYAVEQFENQIQEQGPAFQRQLGHYQRRNHILAPFIYAYWMGRRFFIIHYRRIRDRIQTRRL